MKIKANQIVKIALSVIHAVLHLINKPCNQPIDNETDTDNKPTKDN